MPRAFADLFAFICLPRRKESDVTATWNRFQIEVCNLVATIEKLKARDVRFCCQIVEQIELPAGAATPFPSSASSRGTLRKSAQDFGGGFDIALKLRLVDLADIFAEMVADFLESLFHVGRDSSGRRLRPRLWSAP